MTNPQMNFANRVGGDLVHLLAERAREELSGLPDQERLNAMVGAALITVAEVLRGNVERGARVESLVGFCSRWLTQLLGQVAEGQPE
jgi:hypothetical protein